MPLTKDEIIYYLSKYTNIKLLSNQKIALNNKNLTINQAFETINNEIQYKMQGI